MAGRPGCVAMLEIRVQSAICHRLGCAYTRNSCG